MLTSAVPRGAVRKSVAPDIFNVLVLLFSWKAAMTANSIISTAPTQSMDSYKVSHYCNPSFFVFLHTSNWNKINFSLPSTQACNVIFRDQSRKTPDVVVGAFWLRTWHLIPVLPPVLGQTRASKWYRDFKAGHQWHHSQAARLVNPLAQSSEHPSGGWCKHKPIGFWDETKYKFVEHFWALMNADLHNWYKPVCLCKETQFVFVSDPT